MGVREDDGSWARRLRHAARRGATVVRVAGSLAGSVVRGVVDAANEVRSRRAGQPGHPAPPARPPAPRSPSAAGDGSAPSAAARESQKKPVQANRTPAAEREPIRTKTLARLLAQQGHRDRAIAMYESLIAAHPDDPELAGELEAVRRESAASDGSTQEMVSVAVDERTVWVSWQVSDPGVERASRLLGGPGHLTVRLAVTAPDPAQVVQTRTRELTDVDPAGEWVVRDLPEGARATASIGLRAGERFVSIAHHRAR